MSAASTLPRLKHSPRQTRAAVSSAQLLARRFSLPHDWRSSARIRPYANATLAARSIGGYILSGKRHRFAISWRVMSSTPMTKRQVASMRSPNTMLSGAWRSVLGVTLAAVCFSAALAATPFDALIGAWSGSGQIRYQDGQSEPVRCTAYYTEGGQRLRLAIRCKSTSNEIEIRGQLISRGETVTGTWEERTFHASGEASGRIANNRIILSVAGGGFSGSMSVSYGASRQIVVISTEGISMKSVNVTLTKGG